MISDNLRMRYNLPKDLALPSFFLDCKYDEDDDEEKNAFKASFMNILISAKRKEPYNPKGKTAAMPLQVKLEEEKKEFEEKRVSLEKLAKENEEKARNEALLREKEIQENKLREQKLAFEAIETKRKHEIEMEQKIKEMKDETD